MVHLISDVEIIKLHIVVKKQIDSNLIYKLINKENVEPKIVIFKKQTDSEVNTYPTINFKLVELSELEVQQSIEVVREAGEIQKDVEPGIYIEVIIEHIRVEKLQLILLNSMVTELINIKTERH